MTGNTRDSGGDVAKVDAHVIQPEEYDEVPELTDEWFAKGQLLEAGKPVRRDRPPAERTKLSTTLRLDADVVAHFKAQGAGWQTRINDALRRAAGLR